MPPSFYDPALPPSILSAASSPKSIASNLEPRLPTLAVVLGLIGIFLFITLVASISICIFRGHLFPRTERVQDEEAALYTKDVKVTGPSSPLSVMNHDEVLVEHVPTEPETTKLALRPFLLNPSGPKKLQLRELLLPKLQQVRYHQVGSHSVPTKTRRQSFPFGMAGRSATDLPQTADGRTEQTSLKVSSSSPSVSGQNKAFRIPNRIMHGEQHRSALKSLKLVEQNSATLPLITSSDSVSSAYTQESESSSFSTDSRPWEYYFNNPGDDLFWKPEPPVSPASSGSTSSETPPATPTLIFTAADPIHSQAKVKSERQVTDSLVRPELFKTTELQKHASTRHHRLRKCNIFSIAIYKRTSALSYKTRKTRIQEVLRSVKSRNLYMQASAIDFVSPPLPIYKGLGSDSIVCIDKSRPERSSSPHSKLSLCPSFSSQFKSRTETGKKTHGSPMKISAKKNPFASSVRRPLGIITNLVPLGTKRTSRLLHATIDSVPRPILQLNGVPADDLAFSAKPPRFNRHTSPPRNPVLLSTRWTPRPAIPPVTITVFAKNRSASPSKYPGRRVTVTPPAGTSLSELRGSIERALGHEVRALRGMVFVGRRSMFLPLLTERFYAQWVKERVREGGIGVVEAWHL